MNNDLSHETPLIGAIEAGGTKIICAVGRSWAEVRDAPKLVIPTTTPEESMTRVVDWFVDFHRVTPLAAIGVASFGPLDFSTNTIASTTPKEVWRGASWRDALSARLANVVVGLDTDTNAAGVAEWHWGVAQGRRVAVYVTVGTGIGGGLLIDGAPIPGLAHPEFGHMFVPRQRDDKFLGTCPTHGDCLEGLASGEAVQRRWGRAGEQFAPEHRAWELESDYLALAMVNITMISSPEIIVLGGGVMAVNGLMEKVRKKTRDLVAGYLVNDELLTRLDAYLVEPGLGVNSGVIGAFALGAQTLARQPSLWPSGNNAGTIE